jgi:phosphoglycolate phosphatase
MFDVTIAIACKDLVFDNIEAIIFDKDGTLENSHAFWCQVGIKRAALIDSRLPGIGKSLLLTFGIVNRTLDLAGLMAVGSREENEIAAAAHIAQTGCSWFEAKQIARDTFDEVAKYSTKTTESSPLFADSRETIKSLKQAGLKLGILSADSTSEVKAFVDRHQLQNYIQLNMGSDEGIYKPNPQLFLRACQRLKVEPHRTIMVGDSWGDLAMAKNAGAAAAIGIQRHHSTPQHGRNSQFFQLTNADISIASLLEIVPLADK